MKISEFRKLEKKINNDSFDRSYKTINIVMVVLSYFGHLASIFLAYFLISKVLGGAVDSEIGVFLASIIILSGIELLKRDIFDKFSIQYLKVRNFGSSVLPLFTMSIIIISISFYSSISGAKEFSSKSTQIEESKNIEVKSFGDSITNIYASKILTIEDEENSYKVKIDDKDKEQALINKSLQENGRLSRAENNRNKQLTEEKKFLDNKIKELDTKISSIKLERDEEISKYESTLTKETDSKKDDNSKNSFMFVIISTMIELVILAGVFFNEYYKFRSYKEFRDKIDRDPNYQKWILYDQILSTIYTDDMKINQKLPPGKSMVDMCKLNGLIVLPKDMIDFIKVMSNLGIIKTSGSSRHIVKQKDISFEILKNHFNID